MRNVHYSNAIGYVMYLMVSTRPYIAYALSCLCCYISNLSLLYWQAVKRVLKYLKYKLNCRLKIFKCDDCLKLVGYVDYDYINDIAD